jgi:hypothetical protein
MSESNQCTLADFGAYVLQALTAGDGASAADIYNDITADAVARELTTAEALTDDEYEPVTEAEAEAARALVGRALCHYCGIEISRGGLCDATACKAASDAECEEISQAAYDKALAEGLAARARVERAATVPCSCGCGATLPQGVCECGRTNCGH